MLVLQLQFIYVNAVLICTLWTTDGSTTSSANDLSSDSYADANGTIRCTASDCITDAGDMYHEKPIDCEEILQRGNRKSRVYKIWPKNRLLDGPIKVYCDMKTDGGGWTVIQRRGDFGSNDDYFFKDWGSYKTGFGNVRKDFWIGNDKLFVLTNQRAYKLRINLSDWKKRSRWAVYDEFWIEDEDHKYTLHVKGYNGTAGDSLSFHNKAEFWIKDDGRKKMCANAYKGGWWYQGCPTSNLNGLYLRGKHKSYSDGVQWFTFKGHHYSLKNTAMMIKPVDSTTKSLE